MREEQQPSFVLLCFTHYPKTIGLWAENRVGKGEVAGRGVTDVKRKKVTDGAQQRCGMIQGSQWSARFEFPDLTGHIGQVSHINPSEPSEEKSCTYKQKVLQKYF